MSVLNMALSILWISFSGAPGGEVGMLPFLVGILGILSMVVSGITVAVFQKSYTAYKGVILYEIVYGLMMVLGGSNPLVFFDSSSKGGSADGVVFVLSLVSMFISLGAIYGYKKIRNR